MTKLLEIRDCATYIPAFAFAIDGSTPLGRGAGYGERMIMLGSLAGGRKCHADPYDWADRTWTTAHRYIEEHFDSLEDGDVIDVEFILGETSVKKEPQ